MNFADTPETVASSLDNYAKEILKHIEEGVGHLSETASSDAYCVLVAAAYQTAATERLRIAIKKAAEESAGKTPL